MIVSLARYWLELMSDGNDREPCGGKEDALESFSFVGERGKDDPEDWERRELIGDDGPPSITDGVEQDELEVCLRAPMRRSVRSTNLFLCSLTSS